MIYIVEADILKVMTQDEIDQILGGSLTALDDAEDTALDMVRDYLSDLYVTFVAPNVRGSLPTGPTDDAWEQARPLYVALTPLWWTENRIEGLMVQALHNDEELAIKLSWLDPTLDERAVRQNEFRDGVAIQFSLSSDPPFDATFVRLSASQKSRPPIRDHTREPFSAGSGGERASDARLPPEVAGND